MSNDADYLVLLKDGTEAMISKSYKLPRDLTEQFRIACAYANSSQSTELQKYMKRYINQVKKKLEEKEQQPEQKSDDGGKYGSEN